MAKASSVFPSERFLNERGSKNAVQTQDPSKEEEEETSLEQLRYDAANQII
eukprot:COSAG06_NODE_27361_length_594_cov_2.088889_1_plen_50_part_10